MAGSLLVEKENKMFENIIKNVRDMVPLVHNITNYVTVNDCANVLLACGGSPIMSDDKDEVCEITSICNALNINIGTLNERTIESMFLAGKKANELGHPVILDPVGAGASSLRTKTAINLVNEIKFDVIKGNISEIMTIYNGFGSTKGVDADSSDMAYTKDLDKTALNAMALSKRTGAIIVVTGEVDIVADSETAYAVKNGNRLMSKVSGTGCMLSAMLGAYIAANMDNKLEAALTAVCVMGVAGERAVEKAIGDDKGSASLRTNIIDEIYKLSEASLKELAKCSLLLRKKTANDYKINLKETMKVYAVTDSSWLEKDANGEPRNDDSNSLYKQVELALKGGATFIQLREKNMSYNDFLATAREIKLLTDKYNVPFVINDNVDIAIECDADGVHVGQSDMEASNVRALIGYDKILGVSAHTKEEALLAEKNGADYLGVGAVFSTSTKQDADAVSFEQLKEICDCVNIPVVAIGGINKNNIIDLKYSGIDGVAVVSAIFGAQDIYEATKVLNNTVREIL